MTQGGAEGAERDPEKTRFGVGGGKENIAPNSGPANKTVLPAC